MGTRKNQICYIAHDGATLLGALVCEFNWVKLMKKLPIPTIISGSHVVNDIALAGPDNENVIDALVEAVRIDHPHCAWLSFERLTPICYQYIISWGDKSRYNVQHCENDFSSIFNIGGINLEEQMKLMSKKSRSSLKYYRRLLERGWRVYSKTSSPDSSSENTTILIQFVKLENTGWKGAAGSAIDQIEHTSSFYQALCESACESGLTN